MTNTKMESSSERSTKELRESRWALLDIPHPNGEKRVRMAFGFVLLLLIIDQAIKFAVKLNMMLGESIRLTDWSFIYFTENPGMAFGWEFFDKVFLTLFRIVASVGIGWLVVRTARRSYSKGFLMCMAAICAGAIGNILDSVFYGQIFTSSRGQLAQLVAPGNGYGSWLHGRVVDMFYFPLINTTWPSWVPIVGGDELIFFRPIFNFADACISVGVIMLLIFYAHSFTQLLSTKKQKPEESTASDKN